MVIIAAFLTKTFITLKCSTCIFSGVNQQSQMAQNLQETPISQRNFQLLCTAFIISYGPPSWNYSRSPQVQQFLFWQLYCQTTCLLGMLLSLQSIDVSDIVLGKIGSPRPAQKERMKSLTLFYALFLVVCFISQEWMWGNYTF